MIQAINCTALSVALEKLRQILAQNKEKQLKTIIFCEDRLSLAAERTVCSAVGGSFHTSVYTFARFLSAYGERETKVLSSQGSAMAIRQIIENSRAELTFFKKLSATGAAQAVYDTIALLYSSRVSAEDVKSAAAEGGMLADKLHDLAVIYEKYSAYLKENGLEDRNRHLRKLAPLVESSPQVAGSTVIFLGFQAFTCAATECARAAFSNARDVYGLFIGGTEALYVNEACASFLGAAEDFGGAEVFREAGDLNPAAETLRRSLYDPESYYRPPQTVDNVHIFEATDGTEELEFIAASIKKYVADGIRYGKISVMLPDSEGCERELARVFSQYRIPYYADRRRPLSEHPLCAFVLNFLSCTISGCRAEEVDEIVASPYFPAEEREKDVFRNYMLRLANFRGGVKREPDTEICKNCGFDAAAVSKARALFLEGLAALTDGMKSGICEGIRRLFGKYGVKEKLEEIAKRFRDEYPAAAQFGTRAYEGILTVLAEAEELAGGLPLKEFIKILKSGFAAMKISLIPPKADAVFVGDLSATANTGSDVVFAARLTGDVPGASADAALLTDREIGLLEEVNVKISPKIRQVNARRRETAGLNLCAFRKHLYLTYPVRLNGEEGGVSEIVQYAEAVFAMPSGVKLTPIDIKRLERSGKATPFYCSEKLPAIKKLVNRTASPELCAALYELLKRKGYAAEADAAWKKQVHGDISCGKELYLSYNSLSPTTLESYFACPYLSFVRQGLRAKEREEGAVRAADTGNFIHAVLQELAGQLLAADLNGITDADGFLSRAETLARQKLTEAPYSSLLSSDSGRYTAETLVAEAIKVSGGMYEQLQNSQFRVSAAESKCEVTLQGGVKIFGRIDRVDQKEDMVRVIDYKTGSIDASATAYYMGGKLQLPLYLLSVSEGKRPVGAYYFPASVVYREKADGVFRLQGFMDGSDEVVAASDTTLQPGQKSNYFDAYLNGRKLDGAMSGEEFNSFLRYSRLVAGQGASEILAGNVTPSPAAGICDWCKAGGSCGFAVGKDGEERKAVRAVKCSEIAQIAEKEEGR